MFTFVTAVLPAHCNTTVTKQYIFDACTAIAVPHCIVQCALAEDPQEQPFTIVFRLKQSDSAVPLRTAFEAALKHITLTKDPVLTVGDGIPTIPKDAFIDYYPIHESDISTFTATESFIRLKHLPSLFERPRFAVRALQPPRTSRRSRRRTLSSTLP